MHTQRDPFRTQPIHRLIAELAQDCVEAVIELLEAAQDENHEHLRQALEQPVVLHGDVGRQAHRRTTERQRHVK